MTDGGDFEVAVGKSLTNLGPDGPVVSTDMLVFQGGYFGPPSGATSDESAGCTTSSANPQAANVSLGGVPHFRSPSC